MTPLSNTQKKRQKEAQRDIKRKQKELKKQSKETKAKIKNETVHQRLKNQAKELAKDEVARRRRRMGARDILSAIPYERMYEDGICEVDKGFFSQTLSFSDISYQTADGSEQSNIFNDYRSLWDGFDQMSRVQLTIHNRKLLADEVGGRVFYSTDDDNLTDIVNEYNEILNRKILEGSSNIVRKRYLTYTVNAESYEKAVPMLARIQGSATAALNKIGCSVHQMDGIDRLKAIQAHLRPGAPFTFEYEHLLTSGLTTKDYIAPSYVNFKPEGCDGTYYEMEDTYCQTLVFREFGSELTDKFLSELIDLDIPLSISIHVTPKDKAASIEEVRRKIDFMDKSIIEYQQKALRKGSDPDLLPPQMAFEKQEATDLLVDLREKDQLMYIYTGMVTIFSESFEQLQEDVLRVITTGRRHSVSIDTLKYQQKAGFTSMLPLGVNNIQVSRYFTTAQVAIQSPFATLEISDENGAYYAQNKLSSNLIMLDRSKLAAPMGFILGKPGSGKSFSAKREILNSYLKNKTAEFFIIDPANEYSYICEELKGEAVDIGIGSASHINPLDMKLTSLDVTGQDPIAFKSDFICALVNEALAGEDGGSISPIAKSIIDRCVRTVYKQTAESFTTPLLSDFYQELLRQPEEEAKEIAVGIEIYVKGSQNLFNHHTNIETHKRITTFNIKMVGHSKVFPMLVILDYVYNRLLYNFERGVQTWLYIDEIQSLFNCQAVIKYFDKFWSEGRKYGLVPTGITQIVTRILQHPEACNLLKNSDFILLHKQSDSDRLALQELLQLSPLEASYIDSSIEPGEGLLIAGSRKVPFKDNFPKGKIYNLLNTKFDEVADIKRKQKELMENLPKVS